MNLNKFQLIDAIRHDLGDQEKGLQIKGYMNMKIVTAAIEGLTELRMQLEKADEEMDALRKERERLLAELDRVQATKEATNAD